MLIYFLFIFYFLYFIFVRVPVRACFDCHSSLTNLPLSYFFCFFLFYFLTHISLSLSMSQQELHCANEVAFPLITFFLLFLGFLALSIITIRIPLLVSSRTFPNQPQDAASFGGPATLSPFLTSALIDCQTPHDAFSHANTLHAYPHTHSLSPFPRPPPSPVFDAVRLPV